MASITALRRAALGLALPLCLGLAPALLANEPPAAVDAEESTHSKVVRYTRELEREPAGTEAPEIRRALLDWVMNQSEFVINLCDVMDLPELGTPDRSPITTELTQQMAFGNVAFQIEHGTETDELARQVAAAESVLKAYIGLVAQNPSLRHAKMETLAAQEKAGRLDRHLAPVVADCEGARRTKLVQPGEDMQFLGGFLRDTSLIFPESIGTWQFVSESRFDEAPYGASLRYQRPDDSSGWVDVYVYPIGIVTAEEVAGQAEKERTALLRAWADQLTDPPMSAVSTFSIPVKAPAKPSPYHQPRPATVTAYQVDFGFQREGVPYTYAFVMLADRLHNIEVRYASEAAKLDRAQMRKAGEAFTRDLLPQLGIVSSGACGQPSMGIDGKLADGCDGIEPVTPAVGEGKRELRFEYTPPSS